MDRRTFVTAAGAAIVGAAGSSLAKEPAAANELTLGFSLYGMKTLPLSEAIKSVAQIGYEGVELACLPDWPADPKRLSSEDRSSLRRSLTDNKLTLVGLMLNIDPAATGKRAEDNLAEIAGTIALGRELQPDAHAPIETVLGGRRGEWEKRKDAMARGLEPWAKLAEKEHAVLAIKFHVGNAMQTPEQANWLRERVGSPAIQFAYDYSHLGLQGIDLKKSMAAMLPHTVFIHVKDYVGTQDKFRFVLPGKGDTDYVEYFKLLGQFGYKGCITVEVSGQVWNEKGYDPVAAAKFCFETLDTARRKATT